MKKIKQALITTAHLAGSSWSFMLAICVIVLWAFSGPYFHFSDTWQLVINTATTIITFLMAFCIQFSQDRDTREIKKMLRALMRQTQELQTQLDEIEQEMEEG